MNQFADMDVREYFDKYAQIYAFTGHRDILPEDLSTIERGFVRLGHEWDLGHPVILNNGFARGFDILAYKRFWPHELIVTMPHPVYQYQLDAGLRSLGASMELWSVDQAVCPECFKGDYRDTLGGLAAAQLMKRNEHMVDQSQQVICYWNGVESGGTWNTIKYARKVGKPVRDIREL